MNSGVNALGQGNRANATIGRALQLVVRNVGGGRPGEVDRATLGTPGKYTFCFAEDEAGSPWEPLHVERGLPPTASAVTLFAAEGVRGVVDQLSREPESLARSFASVLRTVAHPKNVIVWDAVLVVSPEHARVFRDAGWTKAPPAEGARRAAADPRLRDRAGRRRHRGRHARRVPRLDAAEVPRRRAPDRARRWRCRALLRDHRRVGERRGRQRAGDEGGPSVSILLDPTGGAAAGNTRARAATGLARRQGRRAARHLEAAGRRVPRSHRGAPPRARHRRAALRQTHVHEAGTARSAPRDRDQVRRGDRSTRRLRIVHVVQCARHRERRSRRDPDGVRCVDRVRSRPLKRRRTRSAPIRRASSSNIRSRTAPTHELHALADDAFDAVLAALSR